MSEFVWSRKKNWSNRFGSLISLASIAVNDWNSFVVDHIGQSLSNVENKINLFFQSDIISEKKFNIYHNLQLKIHIHLTKRMLPLKPILILAIAQTPQTHKKWE